MKMIFEKQIYNSLIVSVFFVLYAVVIPERSLAAGWLNLEKDGLHDPEVPGVAVLQQPEEALSALPYDPAGNKVNWVKALRDKYIEPRSYLHKERKLEVLDLDVLLKKTGDSAFVLFPHKVHTEWLECANCHEELFISKAGATPISMLAILQGEYCGRCHGAVSFPLTECNRCHSVPQDSLSKTKK